MGPTATHASRACLYCHHLSCSNVVITHASDTVPKAQPHRFNARVADISHIMRARSGAPQCAVT
eukprot:7029187-Pyramimonas_sp.AAC.1